VTDREALGHGTERGDDTLEAVLAQGLRELEQDSAPARVEPWARLARLLDRWGRRTNLTGHRGAVEIARRLLLEALALHRALPPARSIADLGSGAGVPGLPLALARPDCEVWLVEARERRHHFQRAAIRELGLVNAHPLRGRVEELDPRPCEGVVSQAFAKAPRALAWMVPWSAPGGWVAIATGPGTEAEDLRHPSLGPGRRVAYAAPGGAQRAVWIAERRAEPGRRG